MNSSVVQKIFDSIQYFTQIERLVIYLESKYSEENSDDLSIKSLESCKKLTHLKIYWSELNDHYFKDIELYLPQLKHLTVHINDKISHNTMYSLAKLNNLKVIAFEGFSVKYPQITDSAICHLINNCSAIQSISFEKGPEITPKIIDALIARVLKRPRIDFDHSFSLIINDAFDRKLDLKSYQIPNNLKLKLKSIEA